MKRTNRQPQPAHGTYLAPPPPDFSSACNSSMYSSRREVSARAMAASCMAGGEGGWGQRGRLSLHGVIHLEAGQHSSGCNRTPEAISLRTSATSASSLLRCSAYRCSAAASSS